MIGEIKMHDVVALLQDGSGVRHAFIAFSFLRVDLSRAI
jgi:hypothetical protein